MTCASGVGHVEKAIAKLPGVSGVSVNLATERADVTFTGASDPHSVVQAIERAGYAVPEADVEIGVAGMTCASCVGHVEMALSKVTGVIPANGNLATEKARIRCSSSHAPLHEPERGITGTGYHTGRAERRGATH